jgi:hypothetical protein
VSSTESSTATDKPSRPDSLTVYADHQEGPHSVRDISELWSWLPVLGPSSVAVALLLATRTAHEPLRCELGDLALTFGMTVPRIWNTLDRLHLFHVVTFASTDIATVRLYLPAPSVRRSGVMQNYPGNKAIPLCTGVTSQRARPGGHHLPKL